VKTKIIINGKEYDYELTDEEDTNLLELLTKLK